MENMRRAKAYLLFFMGVSSILLGGCSGSSKANLEEAAEQPAVVDYTCISNPESDKKIYVILKNYHGAYWEKVIDGITEAAKKLDEAVYLGGIDNETDFSGQIDLMNQAMEQGADGILLAPADSNSLADSCQKVREKEIPVVLIDSSINSGEFDAFKEKGEVLGVYFGHDHNNSFNGKVDDIDLGYTQGAGFHVYGPGKDRGVRVIELNKDSTFKTYDLRFKDLVGKKVKEPLKYLFYQIMPTNTFDAVHRAIKFFIGLGITALIVIILILLFG